jgi:hypothetical protein
MRIEYLFSFKSAVALFFFKKKALFLNEILQEKGIRLSPKDFKSPFYY